MTPTFDAVQEPILEAAAGGARVLVLAPLNSEIAREILALLWEHEERPVKACLNPRRQQITFAGDGWIKVVSTRQDASIHGTVADAVYVPEGWDRISVEPVVATTGGQIITYSY